MLFTRRTENTELEASLRSNSLSFCTFNEHLIKFNATLTCFYCMCCVWEWNLPLHK